MIRDLLFASAAGVSGWTPAELFKNGESGVWFDATDYTTMYADENATIPITPGSGVTVAAWKSKIANSQQGYVPYQASASSMPKTETIGGKMYLAFDGVDDNLQITFPGMEVNPEAGFGMGMIISNALVSTNLYLGSSWSNVFYYGMASETIRASIGDGGTTTISPYTPTPPGAFTIVTGNQQVFLNESTYAMNPGQPNSGSGMLTMISGSGISPTKVSQYVVVNRALTSLEKTQLRAYIAERT